MPPHPFPTAVLMKQGLEGIAAADVSPENQGEEKKSNQSFDGLWFEGISF